MFVHPVSTSLYGFGLYLLITLPVLCIALGLHEAGHILFARLNHLEYRVLFRKGNLTVAADWDSIRDRKVYGNILGIVFGMPPIIAAGWLFTTPLFLLLYLLACYDDFGDVVKVLMNSKRVLGLG